SFPDATPTAGIYSLSLHDALPILFAHRDGICHVYLHAGADPAMAREIVLNAKMRRTSVCGAAETLLVDRDAAARLLPGVLEALLDRKSTRLNSSHVKISYAVFCLK